MIRRMVRRTSTPFGMGVLLGLGLLAAGFVAIAFGWRGTARSLAVPLQVPYLLSGALVALGLIGAGAMLLDTQWERLSDAEERRALDALIEEATVTLEARRNSQDS